MSTRLDGKSFDNIQSRIDELKRLFPEAVKEGRFDPELLVGLLEENDETVSLNEERYDFTWKGKADALRLAQRRSDGTLRPCFEESRDWDTTQIVEEMIKTHTPGAVIFSEECFADDSELTNAGQALDKAQIEFRWI